MIKLVRTNKSDPLVKEAMRVHYTHPKGFVGRQILYKIYDDDVYRGVIGGGSATLHLPTKSLLDGIPLTNIVNNMFFHLSSSRKNLGTQCLKQYRKQIALDWLDSYGDKVEAFETLVEPPRTGAMYLADNWVYTGMTKGYSCRRVSGVSTDGYSGRRIWNTTELHPKLVFVKLV